MLNRLPDTGSMPVHGHQCLVINSLATEIFSRQCVPTLGRKMDNVNQIRLLGVGEPFFINLLRQI